LKEQLKSGNIDIIIGTHALLEEDVIFYKLGLVIIDEQHRF
jgi:ATP-dependent DNA helicase RecG